jgi:hypothetical protein
MPKKDKITPQNDKKFIYYFGVLFFLYKFAQLIGKLCVVVPSSGVTTNAEGVERPQYSLHKDLFSSAT